MAKMTIRQKAFALEYLVDFNGQAAAVRAGYSPKTARSTACAMLQNHQVQTEIARHRKLITDRANITADEVVAIMAKIARFDIRKLYDDRGNLKAPADYDDDTAQVVSSVKAVSRTIPGDDSIETTTEVKLNSKTAALDQLGKYFGLFVDRRQIEDVGRARVILYWPDNGREPGRTLKAIEQKSP